MADKKLKDTKNRNKEQENNNNNGNNNNNNNNIKNTHGKIKRRVSET